MLCSARATEVSAKRTSLSSCLAAPCRRPTEVGNKPLTTLLRVWPASGHERATPAQYLVPWPGLLQQRYSRSSETSQALSYGGCNCTYCCLPIAEGPWANAVPAVGWEDIPADVQHLVLGQAPFKKLAKLAPVCKSLHTVWEERLAQRQLAVDSIQDGTWPEAVVRGLLLNDTELPRDLITPAMVVPVLCQLCCCPSTVSY
jgi:hypothetical protein